MKTRVRHFMTIALVCGLTFTSTNLLAQTTARVPIGRPTSAFSGARALGPEWPYAAPSLQSPHGWRGGDRPELRWHRLPRLELRLLAARYQRGRGQQLCRRDGQRSDPRLRQDHGSILLDEPLASFFGASSGGDPYVVYDDIADRWYVSAFDST